MFEVYISISFFRNPSKCEKERGRMKGRKKKEGREEGRKKKITRLNERTDINEFQARKVLETPKGIQLTLLL